MALENESQTVYRKLEERSRNLKNEAEVRSAWISALESVTGLIFDVERGRRDLSYNNVIIEFKDFSLFQGRANSPAFVNATQDRLPKYIKRAARADALPQEDYIGIAIDGAHIAFGQMQSGVFAHGRLLPFSAMTFRMVADACSSGYRRAVTAQNLVEDFGHRSALGRSLMQGLADALDRALASADGAKAKKIQMLFKEWSTLYGQVADLGVDQAHSISASLGFAWNGAKEHWLAASLFVAHTFHSLLVKLLVGEMISAHGLASVPSLVDDVLAETPSNRFKRLSEDIEEGGFFNAVGLKGFVEEAIFSWYLDAAASDPQSHADLASALAAVLARLHVYRLDTMRRTGRSRDVLRDFYEDIVPCELRKSLGEFYTPDWLAEYTVDQLGFNDKDWLQKRVLDPTCGSGTFLLEVIRRKRVAATKAGLDAGATLDLVLSSVWGFDLNPLAVQTARANVLMAVADLLRECGGKEVEIPVLLADAIYSPAPPPNSGTRLVSYTIGSNVANLEVLLPTELAYNRVLLDRVFEVMGNNVEAGKAYSAVETALIDAGIVGDADSRQWRAALKQTYDRVLDLHKRDWNGIWFRIVRNFFWSATAGTFDAIVGNPPWVRWSNLPIAYRNRAKPTCERYDIFSDTRFFGGNELDISAMITYTTADKWLDHGGRLAFIITQTVFQSPSSQGFRKFRIDDHHSLVPLAVDDLKALRPFAGAANKTAVALFEKRRDARPAYPVPYREWLGIPRLDAHGQPVLDRNGVPRVARTIKPDVAKADVVGRMNILVKEANPASADMAGAPWAIMDAATFARHRELLGASRWVSGRKGITTDLNGLFFVSIEEANEKTGKVKVRTRPQEGRTDIGGARAFWVEPDLLHPLLKGAGDFRANRLRPAEKLFAFVPNKGIDQASLDAATAALNGGRLPATRRYMEAFKSKLEERSTFRTRMRSQGAHFAAIYNVGDYTFAPYKVVWPEMAQVFKAAVATFAAVPLVGERPYVPDHKLYFADFSRPEPAYFLCGLLNCPSVRTTVESHIVKLQIGNVFKHVNLPAFNAEDSRHLELSRMVQAAHGAAGRNEWAEASEFASALAEAIIAEVIKERSV